MEVINQTENLIINQSHNSINVCSSPKKLCKNNVPKPVYLDFNYTNEQMPANKKQKRKSKPFPIRNQNDLSNVVNETYIPMDTIKFEPNTCSAPTLPKLSESLSNLSIQQYINSVTASKMIDELTIPPQDYTAMVTDPPINNQNELPADAQIIQLHALVNQFVKLENHNELFLVSKPMRKKPLTLAEELKKIDEMDINVPIVDTLKKRERKQILQPKIIYENDMLFEEIDLKDFALPEIDLDIVKEELELHTSLEDDELLKNDLNLPKSKCVRPLFKNVSPEISSTPIKSEKRINNCFSPHILMDNKIIYKRDMDSDSSSSDEYTAEPSIKSLKCWKCSKFFITPRSLVKHKKCCKFVNNFDQMEVKKETLMTTEPETLCLEPTKLQNNEFDSKLIATETVTTAKYCCTICDRTFQKLNGFISHKKTHNRSKEIAHINKLDKIDKSHKSPKTLKTDHYLRLPKLADIKNLPTTGRRYPRRQVTMKSI